MTTNKEFAATDRNFRTACSMVVEHDETNQMCQDRTCAHWKKVATKRQASKFRRGKGRVYRGILA